MKKLSYILLLTVFAFLPYIISAQEENQDSPNKGQYFSIQNTKLYYEEYGEGTPLILLHGGLMTIEYFRSVIPELSNYFRVIAVDCPGHGRSYHTDSLSFQLISDYISEMIDIMDLDSTYVLGCSMGSMVALILAHDRPDKIKRIISDGGVINTGGWKPGTAEFFESISSETWNKRYKGWIDWYKSVNPQGDQLEEFLTDFREMCLDLNIPETKVENIRCRTLIIMGDRDNFITLEHGLKLFRSIEGSEFCVIPNAGHCICDKKPDLMNKIVIDFLTKE